MCKRGSAWEVSLDKPSHGEKGRNIGGGSIERVTVGRDRHLPEELTLMSKRYRTFEVGDRVTRLQDVFDLKSELMRGAISRRYTQGTRYRELYEVHWDHQPAGITSRGYLPHGLNKE